MRLSRRDIEAKLGPNGYLVLVALWRSREDGTPYRCRKTLRALVEDRSFSLSVVTVTIRKLRAAGMVSPIGKLRDGKLLHYVIRDGIEVEDGIGRAFQALRGFDVGRGVGGGAPKHSPNRLGGRRYLEGKV